MYGASLNTHLCFCSMEGGVEAHCIQHGSECSHLSFKQKEKRLWEKAIPSQYKNKLAGSSRET